MCITGWRRLIGCLESQVVFRKRATSDMALLWKMTCEDHASYDSTPPCTTRHIKWGCVVSRTSQIGYFFPHNLFMTLVRDTCMHLFVTLVWTSWVLISHDLFMPHSSWHLYHMFVTPISLFCDTCMNKSSGVLISHDLFVKRFRGTCITCSWHLSEQVK